MQENTSSNSNSNLVRPIQNPVRNSLPIMIVGGVLVILVGLGVGWIFAGKKINSSNTSNSVKSSSVKVSSDEAGVTDTSKLDGPVTGVLKTGGIKGEGTFHLERPGGVSQNVYLTSTIVDMNPFVDKKVQIWGQTQAAHYAGWFMDVSKIKVT